MAVAVAWLSAGRLLVRQDQLGKADAIYVLGGSWANRWLEAVDLYRGGWAPLILLSAGGRESGELVLAARGVHVPGSAELGRDVMVRQLGLPASAVEVLPDDLDNTAQEAAAIRERAHLAGWHAVIVITDLASTRRAGYAFRRELGGALRVIVRAPRLDQFDGAHWWRTRSDFRTVFYEAPKLLAYWLGLRG
jgi:uncharacterized SAM-binding protein YcdF (DUF218 family)